jgi:signal transduction histidine kinase
VWFVAAVLCGVAALLPVPAVIAFALNVVSYVAIGIGIARYRLFDIELYLPRAIAYAVLSAVAVGGYLLVVAVVGERADPGLAAAAVTALLALALARLVGRVQQAVQRLLFGARSRPDAALAELGRRLAGALHPDEVLPVSVEAVRASLHLPYAAVHLADEEAPACEVGRAPALTASFPLAHAGEPVGRLTVGLRSGERELAAADERILQVFASQVAVAAHGVQATRALRRSREHVVRAHETERGRIHRDLHDGLGPALAGITLGLETAGRVALRDTEQVGGLLEQLRADAAECVDEVRRIVADLRPPALDDVGLFGALVRQADVLTERSGGRLQVRVTGGEGLGTLPPSIEAAAYRIAVEAVTNVVRHAEATSCTVRLERAANLVLRIEDDGTGRPPTERGTGLASMRQRAEEVGGRCLVLFRPSCGVLVDVELPLAGQTR